VPVGPGVSNDLLHWDVTIQYWGTPGPTISAVPEPSTFVIAYVGWAWSDWVWILGEENPVTVTRTRSGPQRTAAGSITLGSLAFSLRRSELPVDDDPEPWYLLLTDPQRPYRKLIRVVVPARCLADRHERVECFKNTDRAGDLDVADRARLTDVGEELRQGISGFRATACDCP